MKVIGLTGGVATGKSTVASLLRERDVPVVDADVAARAVVEPGEPALQRIVARFGPRVLDPTGHLDRAAMRRIIIADPGARHDLEAITHPAIFAHVQKSLDALKRTGHRVAVVEAALMVETQSYRNYDALVVVTCSPETQLARLMERDGQSEKAARGLMAAQLPLADKEAVADIVIRNDGGLDELRAAVAEVWVGIDP